MALSQVDIIKKAIPIFKEKGYGATSMADIANACGILKGSLYHHFSSKEALMEDILIYLKNYFLEKVFVIALNNKWPVEKRLERLARKSEEQFLEGPGGCFMAMIGTETVIQNAVFNKIIIQFFADWKHAFVQLYKEVFNEAFASELADKSIIMIEGAVLMMRIHNNPDYLTSVQQNLVNEFKEMKSKLPLFSI